MKTKNKIIISNTIFIFILLIAYPVITMSPMMLGNADGIHYSIILTIIYSLWTYLPVLIIGLVTSIIFYKKGKQKAAFRLSLLPVLNIIVFILSFLMFFVINSINPF